MGEHTNTETNYLLYRGAGSHRGAGPADVPVTRRYRLLVGSLVAVFLAAVGVIVGAGWAAAAEAGQTLDRVGNVLVQLDPGDTPGASPRGEASTR